MADKPVFIKATKTQAKLRMAIAGPSGSGKTYTGLIFATALADGGRIAVIDTEHGSASKYADLWDFDTLFLTRSFHPDRYIAAIRAAEDAGYSVLLIDSLSHAYDGAGGVLELHQRETDRIHNSFAAWRVVTPIHQRLVYAMLGSGLHIIATMRSKMEYIQIKDGDKTRVKKVGMAPIQRPGMEYEFDIVAEMDLDHRLAVTKTHLPLLALDEYKVVDKPTAEWFEAIRGWLSEGAEPPANLASVETEQVEPKAVKPKESIGFVNWPASGQQRFWIIAQEVGLSHDAVHEEFDVESMKDWDKGTMAQAKTILDIFAYGMGETLYTKDIREALNTDCVADWVLAGGDLEIAKAAILDYMEREPEDAEVEQTEIPI